MKIPEFKKTVKMKYWMSTILAVLLLASPDISKAQGLLTQTNAFDFGANYGGTSEPSFATGGNGGFGFGSWTINATPGSGGAGAFIGNPSSGGIAGMSTESFGLYANSVGSGASVNASRPLLQALAVGETFRLQWGINFDGDNGINGNKGLNLYVGSTQIINLNNGGNPDIQFNSVNTGFGYGTTPMVWSFTRNSSTTLLVEANDRDGTGTFSQTFTRTEGTGITSFQIYATELRSGDNRQPYFNDFTVTVPEPSSASLMALGAAGLLALRRRRNA
jgi:hypothetical protein